MAVLVTGGAGYIGSHTCVELLNSGEDIVVIDNFSNSKPEALKRIEKLTGKSFKSYKGDLLCKADMEKVFRENDIKSVIHFAGLKAVGESVRLPLKYYENNISGTVNLLEAMKNAGCKRLIFSSSATVYGLNNIPPFKEDFPLSATNPYGASKLMIEMILNDLYTADNDFSIVLLRYFNPIGAHKSGLLGEDPNDIPNNLLPYISQVAVGKLECLNVFGNDYGTPDGTGIRDYLHVVDLALGHIKALKYSFKQNGIEAINLGTGKGCSVLDIINAFIKASGKDIPYKIAPRRPGDIAASYASPEKAEKLLGWKAERTIEEMCEDSWNFIKNNPEGM